MSGGGSVALRLEKLGEAILRNELEHENAQRRYEQSSRGPFGFSIEMPPMLLPVRVDLRVTIMWKTPLDRQKIKEFRDRDAQP